jgi:flavin-dependent dehydrogenase
VTAPVDLLIVGGGTAGWATAIHARRAGLTVRLWDPGHEGRPVKPCGEGLAPAALREIEALCGALPDGAPFEGIEYRHGALVARAAFKHGPGRGVPRLELLRLLARTGIAAGVELVETKATTWKRTDRGVEVDGVPGRVLVAADGLKSRVRGAFGLGDTNGRSARWGARTYARVTRAPRDVVVHWSRRAELYVTPVAEDRVNVAILASLQTPLPEALSEFAAELAALGELEGPWAGAGPFGEVPRRRTATAFACVGDAAGFIDPITGEGNRLALQASRALVAAIVEDRLPTYEAEWRRLARSYALLTRCLLWSRRQLGPAPVVRLAAARPAWFEALVGTLAET